MRRVIKPNHAPNKLPVDRLDRALGQTRSRIDASKVDLGAAMAIILEAGLDAVGPNGERVIDRAVSMLCAPLVRWLIDQGCDIASSGSDGDTPLHAALYWKQLEIVNVLLAAGAPIEAAGRNGYTPLTRAFVNCFCDPTPFARALLERGAIVTDHVRTLGDQWNPTAFSNLLRDFGISHEAAPNPEPAPTVASAIGRIGVPPGPWKRQFEALWKMLVPSRGAATTLQGEVIRLSGKLTREAYGNGNINWNPTLAKAWQFIGATLVQDETLSPAQQRLLTRSLAEIIENHHSPDVSGDGSPYYLVQEMVVQWVVAHHEPIAFAAHVAY